jgi:molybdopterin-containing oxidoreductase family membrane subunit
MNTHATTITGLFKSEEETLAAIHEIRENGWQVKEVRSPVPADRIAEALGRRKSRVGWFTLTGGVIGFFSGFSLPAFTATRWSLIVSGKPVLSWIPFFIIAFEFTILFAVFGNVLGLLTQTGLPAKEYETNYHEECSGDMYGIEAVADPGQTQRLKEVIRRTGTVKNSGPMDE